MFSGITGIATAHVLYYTAIQRMGATIPMLVVLAQPSFLVFGLSSPILHEWLNGPQLLCGAVLLIGSGLSMWAQQHLRSQKHGPKQ